MRITRRHFLKKSMLWGGAFFLCGEPIRAVSEEIKPVYPGYARLEAAGELKERVEAAAVVFEECRLCPRECGANRWLQGLGFCRATDKVRVHSVQPHFGEERSLVGVHGSGTIFFSHCNLRCVFCQNWPISHLGYGQQITDAELADQMLFLQKIGCHNINLVTPTHVMPNILNAVRIACRKGLRLPLVYNTSGYERKEIIALLDGIVDIYLPDLKFMDAEMAANYSGGAADYPERAQEAIEEMHRQVGVHTTDTRGIALRGLMIRHLVMPNRVSGTEKFVQWVAQTLTKSTYVNLMAQYHVAYRAFEYKQIWRRITIPEYLEAMAWAESYGLTNLDPDSVRMRDLYRKRSKQT